MSQTIVRKTPFAPSRPVGGYVVRSSSGAIIATGTKEQLLRRMEFYGEGAVLELRRKAGP